MKPSHFLRLSNKAVKPMCVFLLTSISLFHLSCAIMKSGTPPKKHGYGKLDKYGCQEPPPDVFTSAGLDFDFASSTFGKIVTGEIKVQTKPEVLNLASKAIHEARIRDYLRCLASKRDGYNLEQAAYQDRFYAFMAANPSATEFIEWQKNNPFPKSEPTRIENGEGTGSASQKIEIKDSPGSIATFNQVGDNIIVNPKPENKLSYEVINLNQKVGDLYQSEFRLSLEIPPGGTFSLKDIKHTGNLFSSCEKVLRVGTISSLKFGTHQITTTQYHNIICMSSKPIEDNGQLFKL